MEGAGRDDSGKSSEKGNKIPEFSLCALALSHFLLLMSCIWINISISICYMPV